MPSLETLQLLIYLVLMFTLVAYATLDGFDLGVGCLHLFAKGDTERRIMLNAIGPVWDGNSTWIVIGGGLLFAAFPKAFTTLLPNLYTPAMGVLFGFMLRATAIEFRSKKSGKKWRSFWDGAFSLASVILAFLFGLSLGNVAMGIPLNNGVLEGGVLSLFRWYPALIALFGVATFSMHGSIFLLMKTEGEFHDRIRVWAKRLIALFLAFWIASSVATYVYNPHMIAPFSKHPWLLFIPLTSISAILAIPYAIKKKKDGLAFIFSCTSILFLMVLYVVGTFPNIALSSIDPDKNSLTFVNSSGSLLSMTVIAGIAATAIPLAFFYVSYIYRVFRGKVKIDHTSY